MTISISKQATKLARQTLLLAFAGLVLLMATTVAAVTYVERDNRAAVARLAAMQHAVGLVQVAEQRMALAVQMAAATSEPRWSDRYSVNLNLRQEALNRALNLAPPAIAARFHADVDVPMSRLRAADGRAFEAIAAGRLSAARAMLNDTGYETDARVVHAGVARFIDDALAAQRAASDAMTRRLALVLTLMGLMLAAGAGLLMRQLHAILKQSELATSNVEGALRDLATHDGLTGFLNHRGLNEQMQGALARAGAARTKVALLLVDLEGFKRINDRHGHVVGDLALKEVARRLTGLLRHGEICARLGGVRFAVAVEFAADDVVRRLAHALVECLRQPMRLDHIEAHVSACVGVAITGAAAQSADDLERKAEIALERAQCDGRAAVRAYEASMEAELQDRENLAQDLRRGLVAGEVAPYFLPLIDLRSGAIQSFELLPRWRHPVRGELMPREFLPAAEMSGQMNDLTMTILRAACKDLRGLPGYVGLTLNVALRQMQDDAFAAGVLEELAQAGVPAEKCEIDIREADLVADPGSVKRVVTALKQAGVRIALDDFGAAYSSLRYLADLPFDAIKIDGALVRTLDQRGDSAKIITAIVGLGRNLGVKIVAEHVETPAQVSLLTVLGCDAAQGFYFGKPMNGAAALALAPRADKNGRGSSALA